MPTEAMPRDGWIDGNRCFLCDSVWTVNWAHDAQASERPCDPPPGILMSTFQVVPAKKTISGGVTSILHQVSLKNKKIVRDAGQGFKIFIISGEEERPGKV